MLQGLAQRNVHDPKRLGAFIEYPSAAILDSIAVELANAKEAYGHDLSVAGPVLPPLCEALGITLYVEAIIREPEAGALHRRRSAERAAVERLLSFKNAHVPTSTDLYQLAESTAQGIHEIFFALRHPAEWAKYEAASVAMNDMVNTFISENRTAEEWHESKELNVRQARLIRTSMIIVEAKRKGGAAFIDRYTDVLGIEIPKYTDIYPVIKDVAADVLSSAESSGNADTTPQKIERRPRPLATGSMANGIRGHIRYPNPPMLYYTQAQMPDLTRAFRPSRGTKSRRIQDDDGQLRFEFDSRGEIIQLAVGADLIQKKQGGEDGKAVGRKNMRYSFMAQRLLPYVLSEGNRQGFVEDKAHYNVFRLAELMGEGDTKEKRDYFVRRHDEAIEELRNSYQRYTRKSEKGKAKREVLGWTAIIIQGEKEKYTGDAFVRFAPGTIDLLLQDFYFSLLPQWAFRIPERNRGAWNVVCYIYTQAGRDSHTPVGRISIKNKDLAQRALIPMEKSAVKNREYGRYVLDPIDRIFTTIEDLSNGTVQISPTDPNSLANIDSFFDSETVFEIRGEAAAEWKRVRDVKAESTRRRITAAQNKRRKRKAGGESQVLIPSGNP